VTRDLGWELHGALLGQCQAAGPMVRRPVFPPSEHSSLSRNGSKGFAPGGAANMGKASDAALRTRLPHAPRRQRAAGRRTDRPVQGHHRANGGKVAKTEQWGVKSLAYRLRKNRKAHFTLFNIDALPAALNEIERQHRLSEDVSRYLTVRVHEQEEGPPAMMRKVARDRERDARGFGFRDRDRGGFRDRDRGEHRRDRERERDGRPPREGYYEESSSGT